MLLESSIGSPAIRFQTIHYLCPRTKHNSADRDGVC